MSTKTTKLGKANPESWLKGAVEVTGKNLEKIRKIPQKWNKKKWKLFPDAGMYQMTRLTANLTNGSCNAYYIKLRKGEVFPIHKHPNAVHIMIGIKGKGNICWRENKNKPKYCTNLKFGNGVFAITPETEHAILANQNQEVIFLVINAPAENIKTSNYQITSFN